MPAALLIPIYFAVVLLPLALAWMQNLPTRSVIDELATGAGLLALVIILAEFVLSGRFRVVSSRIGMDVTMRFHQLLARSALVLALAHPFFYSTAFNRPYPFDPTRQLTLSTDMAGLAAGAVSWIVLPAFILLAISRSRSGYRYESWRLLHGIGAVVIAGFGVFHALQSGRYSADPVLAAFWIALLAIALASLGYVYVLKPLMQMARPWTVTAVDPVADKTWEIRLRPDGHSGLAYRAGHFVWLNIGHPAFSLYENPFSLSSAPSKGPEIRAIIKELGDFTDTIGSVPVGTRAYVDGPHGSLHIDGEGEIGIALIAGGVGIAPLIGILRELAASGDRRPVTLIYGNRIESQIACRAELTDLAAAQGSRIVYVLSDPPPGWTGATGMIDPPLLATEFGTVAHREWLYVLCGPPPMIETVEDTLIDLGVPPRNIQSERFSYEEMV